MDSSQEDTSLARTNQEAANRAQIKSYYVAVITLIITILTAVGPYLIIWFNSERGTVMLKGWLPIILLLCSSAASVTALLIVWGRWLQNKRLKSEIVELNTSLSKAETTAGRVDGLLDEKQKLGEELSRRDSENKGLQRQLGEAQQTIKQLEGGKRKLPPAPETPKPKLAFEIDEQNSQVLIERGGPRVSRITAELRIRCEKETDSRMTVRGFHLSLHRLEADGQVTVIPYQRESQVIWEDTNGTFVAASDGWTIDKPRSDFRYYHLTIEITPKIQAELTPDHFLQVTMDAIGQDPLSKPVFVKVWTPESRYSLISLNPFEVYPPEAQREIDELNEKLESYEKTNARLGEHSEKLKADAEAAKKLAEETNKRLNEEVNQRNNWMNSYYETSRKLADLGFVEKILKDQKDALQKHVVILRDFKVRVDLIDTRFGPPRIRFGFKIRNEALPNITIHEKGVGGKVYFRDYPLTETCRFDPNMASKVENIEHKAEGELYLDQKLTDSEIDRITRWLNDPNAEFSFEHVIIKVSGGDNFPHEAAEPLHIPAGDYQRVKLIDCQLNSNTESL
jgi:hypothetical protein